MVCVLLVPEELVATLVVLFIDVLKVPPPVTPGEDEERKKKNQTIKAKSNSTPTPTNIHFVIVWFIFSY